MQKRDLIQANASLENLRQNLDMKDFAKEILLEENYNKFIRSYKFTFWFQLIGGVWMLLSMVIPPTRIYRKFAKWYRKSDVSIRDLDEIFY